MVFILLEGALKVKQILNPTLAEKRVRFPTFSPPRSGWGLIRGSCHLFKMNVNIPDLFWNPGRDLNSPVNK